MSCKKQSAAKQQRANENQSGAEAQVFDREPSTQGIFLVGAPCFSRGSWTRLPQAGFSPAETSLIHERGFSPGESSAYHLRKQSPQKRCMLLSRRRNPRNEYLGEMFDHQISHPADGCHVFSRLRLMLGTSSRLPSGMQSRSMVKRSDRPLIRTQQGPLRDARHSNLFTRQTKDRAHCERPLVDRNWQLQNLSGAKKNLQFSIPPSSLGLPIVAPSTSQRVRATLPAIA